MNLKEITLQVLILLNLSFFSKAKASHYKTEDKGYLIITGEISNVDSNKSLQTKSIEIFSGDATHIFKPLPNKSHKYVINVKDGYFECKLIPQTKISYLKLNVIKSSSFLTSGLPIVLVGDSIHIKIDGSKFSISGTNSYFIRYQRQWYEKLNYLYNTQVNISNVPNLFLKCDSAIRELRNETKFDSIDKELRCAFLSDYEARLRSILFNRLYYLKYSNDQKLKQLVHSYLIRVEEPVSKQDHSFLINNSFHYLGNLFLLNELKEMFRSNSDGNDNFDKLYCQISNSYVGLLKDRLITYLFWKKYGMNGNADTLINGAVIATKDQVSKIILSEIRTAKLPGKKAFNFYLPDSSGNRRSLYEFKGKIVVMHFWFTGCIACQTVFKSMSPLIKRYSGNTEIIFINVNVDKEKTVWLKSLNEELYADKSEISLYTEGLSVNHPFLKFYNFVSFPQFLIVDQFSNIISTNPVRPYDEKSTLTFDVFLTELIFKKREKTPSF